MAAPTSFIVSDAHPDDPHDHFETVFHDESECTVMVERILADDAHAVEDLYRYFYKGVRYQLYRSLGIRELDDRVHDTFLLVLQAIRRGELREPARLMGYVRTVVRRQIACYIDQTVQQRRDAFDVDLTCGLRDKKHNPEDNAIRRENRELMAEILSNIDPRDREILTRFYLLEQSQEQICAEMEINDTQFRLLKSRAKARFGELGRRRMTKWPWPRNFLRKNPG
jgi:RNA polymerase sigma factor (sigma-70 family)